MNNQRKKLIEVALPLEAINAASVREKSIRHGHPSTLHLWWARRPLAAARAVIFSSLVDDPSSHPEEFPTEEAQNAERERLFKLIEELVKWENTNNQRVLDAVKAEIWKSTDGNPPPLLDPFAGGGSIPLEAQRLGLEAHASDLNPVAVMINKAMIEIPPRFAGQHPVNPESRRLNQTWAGAQGLAEDVRYYGDWMKQKAFERIGHLYPKVKDEQGQEHTVIAWIWARTVKCPNPACGCEMPLASSFVLSKKDGKEAFIQPVIEDKKVHYEIRQGKDAPERTVGRTGARCLFCDAPVELDYIRLEGRARRIGSQMMAIVAEGKNGRLFFAPTEEHYHASVCQMPDNAPQSDLPDKALGFRVQNYGMIHHKDLFTNRQLTALTTLSELAREMCSIMIGNGSSVEYAQAVSVYLAFLVDQLANHSSSVCGWNSPNTQMRNTFARQAVSMVWDYAECNVFSDSSGSLANLLERLVKGFNGLPASLYGTATQHDAQSDCGLRNIMISTDPPYYDNIGYADLSDFFYVWLRQTLKEAYPDLFKTMLVPKTEELIANPFRFGGNMEDARIYFEDGMAKTFRQINEYTCYDFPVTIYYAFKQSETDGDEEYGDKKIVSAGWETMLSAVIRSGFCITGTWPLSTEKVGRTRDISSNALASSIVLVCRKRHSKAPSCARRDFISTLKHELKPALAQLQFSNIAPVDLAQSAIGPGMSVYSRYSQVLEADGTPMSVRSALQIINQEIDLYFNEQDGELDRDSRFCVDLFTQYAFNEIKFGEADVLARAKNTSVDRMKALSFLYSDKGVVRLLTREEIPEKVNQSESIIWLLTQQLTHALEAGGIEACAKIVADIFGSTADHAKALAYRLFTIAERKAWASEAYVYNNLVISWPEIQSRAAELQSDAHNVKQSTLFE